MKELWRSPSWTYLWVQPFGWDRGIMHMVILRYAFPARKRVNLNKN